LEGGQRLGRGDGQKIENERDPSQVEPPYFDDEVNIRLRSLGTQLSLIVPKESVGSGVGMC
jgi:hypothetical protein